MKQLGKNFFTGRPTPQIARDLLCKRLCYRDVKGQLSGLIVETEAYCGIGDVASHAYGNRRTAYTASLFQEPGTLYLYQIRGWICCDIVTQPVGEPQGGGVERSGLRDSATGNSAVDGPGSDGNPSSSDGGRDGQRTSQADAGAGNL